MAVEENGMMFQNIGGGIGTYIGNGVTANFDPYATVQGISGAMAQEFAAQNLGAALAMDFAKQVEASASMWEAGGRRGADHAINGFRAQVMGSNLDDVWLSKLAGEVAPLVAAQLSGEAMANNATRDGGSNNADAPPLGDAPSGYVFQ